MKHALLLILLFNCAVATGQTLFTGQLLNKADNAPVPYAVVKLQATGQTQITDSLGKFVLVLPVDTSTVSIEVAALGFHGVINHKRTNAAVEKVYMNKPALNLGQVEIQGLSAKKVVEQAIEKIPQLCANTSYATNAFYRQIHKENGRFVKLIEVQGSTMFRLIQERKKIGCKEAIAIVQMRRSFDYEKNRLEHLDHYMDLLAENPVYHTIGTVLNAAGLGIYKFSFDTAATTNDTYVINFRSQDYTGESIESGRVYILKESFAITKIERFDRKNTNGDYRAVLSQQYVTDFISGSFSAEYEEVNGKWYLKRLLREYTNQIYDRFTGNKSSYITETFEWYAEGEASPTVPPALVDSYAEYTNLYKCDYKYDAAAWQEEKYPYLYFTKDEVYKGLSHTLPMEEQFLKAGE